MDGKYSKVLTVLLILAIVVILVILLFLGGSTILNNMKKADAEAGADTFIENAKNKNKNKNTTSNETTNSVNANTVDPLLGVENLLVSNTISDVSSKKQNYKGFPQVGVIEIPTTKLKCPILEEASKSAIEVAVAVYEGVGLNKVGNTTIVGHNYRNGTFFSDNKKIAVGDKIYITDESGNKVTYVVYNTVTTSPEDSSYFGRDTQGAREITLDTCTDDTQSRLLILAKEE